MASPEPKKSNSDSSSLVEMDMISNLPDDVKEKILTYLPIKEAGRTSILSNKWRYTWSSIPELVFPDDIDTPNLTELVNTIFILHNGPIRKFTLVAGVNGYNSFDKWMVNLSRNGIRELTLDLSNGDEYVMHSRFFSCEQLNHIHLTNCSFKLPLHFGGFKLLHTLSLEDLNVSENDIEKLISSCPMLKQLTLKYFVASVVLNIHAPNLQILELASEFSDLQLYAPKLLSLFVSKMDEVAGNQPPSNKFERVLGNLPTLQNFTFGAFFSQYMCDEPFGEVFFPSFNHVENLGFSLDFSDEKEVVFVLAMFRRTPHLKSLSIQAHVTEGGPTLPIAKFWKTIDRREGLFKHLQTVDFSSLMHVDSMFSFVEFILTSAPQLVTLTIEKYSDDEQEEETQDEGIMLKELQDEQIMSRELLLFKRASPNAEIIFQ